MWHVRRRASISAPGVGRGQAPVLGRQAAQQRFLCSHGLL